MTKNKARTLFLYKLGRLLLFAEEQKIEILLTDFDRTPEEQRRLVHLGSSKTLNSRHLDWLAVDLLVLNGTKDYYRTLGVFWEALHPLCKWGGHYKTFVDEFHFEFSPDWKTYEA